MIRQPTLFISHGAPTILIEKSPASEFLSSLGNQLEKPRAILCVTAHWPSRLPAITTNNFPKTIHDFGGFPEALYQMNYPAPGSPELGTRIYELLKAEGIEAKLNKSRGNDHGTWVPLKLAYPTAGIPVVQLSVQPHETPTKHFEIGQVLRPLRDENILIIGSGAITHNLSAYFNREFDAPPDWMLDFIQWVKVAIETNNVDDLVNFQEKAPYWEKNHPTMEHFWPLFVALGASSPELPGKRLHHSIDGNVMAMDAYRFD